MRTSPPSTPATTSATSTPDRCSQLESERAAAVSTGIAQAKAAAAARAELFNNYTPAPWLDAAMVAADQALAAANPADLTKTEPKRPCPT